MGHEVSVGLQPQWRTHARIKVTGFKYEKYSYHWQKRTEVIDFENDTRIKLIGLKLAKELKVSDFI